MKHQRRYFLKACAASSMAISLAKANAIATDDRLPSTYPGGVADLRWRKASITPPEVRYGLSTPSVLDQGEYWRCLIGVSLDTLPGQYLLYINESDEEIKPFSLPFIVHRKPYPVEIVENPNLILVQTPKEFDDLEISNSIPPDFPFIPPVDTNWKNNYGRYFVSHENATENQRQQTLVVNHNDLKNGEIKPVVAPQNGIVTKLADSYLLNQSDSSAKMMIIDHGHGLFSCLNGVLDVTVSEGNGIAKGAVLGKIRQLIKTNQDQAGSRSNKQLQNVLSNYSVNNKTKTPLNPVIFSWQCKMNQALIDPLVLTGITI